MVLNFWSAVLIASASQCVFLVLLLLTRKSNNRAAQRILVALLLVLLAITVHNLWYAGRIYYVYPRTAGLGRGLSLIVGPLFYLYTRAITDVHFRFHWKQLLHLIPYLLVTAVIQSQQYSESIDEGIALVDSFMSTGLKATPLSLGRFTLYSLQMLVYVFLARNIVKSAMNKATDYHIPVVKRGRWIMKVNLLLIAVSLILVVSMLNALITGLYGYYANFWLTLAYSLFIYLIAYQAVSNSKALLPDFNKKYSSINLGEKKNELLDRLIELFEEEKIFLHPQLKLADVAGHLQTSPHILTSLINQELGKTFFELLNQYRVEEFILRARNPEFAHLSIMGIAQEVGYKSKSSFNTAFKKQMGTTPSEYLKKAD